MARTDSLQLRNVYHSATNISEEKFEINNISCYVKQ